MNRGRPPVAVSLSWKFEIRLTAEPLLNAAENSRLRVASTLERGRRDQKYDGIPRGFIEGLAYAIVSHNSGNA